MTEQFHNVVEAIKAHTKLAYLTHIGHGDHIDADYLRDSLDVLMPKLTADQQNTLRSLSAMLGVVE